MESCILQAQLPVAPRAQMLLHNSGIRHANQVSEMQITL